MLYQIVFTPEAERQLAELYRYLAVSASPEVVAGLIGTQGTAVEPGSFSW